MLSVAGVVAVPPTPTPTQTPTPTPTPTPTTVVPAFGPNQNVSGDVGASAGLYAFGIVVGLILVTVVIFISMNRSLRRVRTNLGSSILPRREADQLPVAPRDSPDPPDRREHGGRAAQPPEDAPPR